MEINLRKFIFTLFLSTLSLPFLSNTFLANTLIEKPLFNISDVPGKLKEASLLRKKRKWKAAKKIYEQIITVQPDEIRAYDGLKKIILSLDKNNLSEILNVYLSELNINPNNVSFYERLACFYSSIAQGNKKLSHEISSPPELLNTAINYLEKAKKLDPNNPAVYAIYKKLLERKDLKMDLIDSRDNKDLKQLRKNNAEVNKKAVLKMNPVELEKNITTLVAKENSSRKTFRMTPFNATLSNRTKQTSKLYVASIHQLKKEGNINEAIKKSQELYNFTNGSDNALSIVKKLCYQFNKPEELLSILRNNHLKKDTFWSGIALIDGLIFQFNNQQISTLAEAKNLLNTLTSKRKLPIHIFEWEYRNVLLSIYSKEIEAYTKLMNFGNSLIGISSAHTINRYTTLCVIYFTSLNQKENALQIIDIALQSNSTKIIPNSIYEKVKLVNRNKNMAKEIHQKQLFDLRNKLIQSL